MLLEWTVLTPCLSAAFSDAVVSDAMVSDAVVSDAVVSDDVVSEGAVTDDDSDSNEFTSAVRTVLPSSFLTAG